MKVKFVATISTVLIMGLLASCSPGADVQSPDAGSGTNTEVADPCAAKDPCAGASDPCAAKTVAAIPEGGVYVEDGVAIKGTDPVAYFTEGKPVAGSAEFAYDWRGATWHFSTAENRDRFASNPEEYAPQYGGYCAYAVSQGGTAPTVPDAWKIVDGKLYLNVSKSIQKRWEKDIPGYITLANENWPGVLKG